MVSIQHFLVVEQNKFDALHIARVIACVLILLIQISSYFERLNTMKYIYNSYMVLITMALLDLEFVMNIEEEVHKDILSLAHQRTWFMSIVIFSGLFVVKHHIFNKLLVLVLILTNSVLIYSAFIPDVSELGETEISTMLGSFVSEVLLVFFYSYALQALHKNFLTSKSDLISKKDEL